MSSETLLIVLGAVISLLFSYVPGLASWYQPLDETKKRLIMLGLLAVIAGAVFGISCWGIFSWVKCTQEGLLGLVTAFVFAAMANQATSSLSPKVGLRAPLSKNVEITGQSGMVETVGVRELGTTAEIIPDPLDDDVPIR